MTFLRLSFVTKAHGGITQFLLHLIILAQFLATPKDINLLLIPLQVIHTQSSFCWPYDVIH